MESWVGEIERIWKETLAEEQPDGVWFVGDAGKHEPAIERLRALLGDRLHTAACDMEGEAVGRLGSDRLMQGITDDVHALVPNYTQLAEAEKLLRKP